MRTWQVKSFADGAVAVDLELEAVEAVVAMLRTGDFPAAVVDSKVRVWSLYNL